MEFRDYTQVQEGYFVRDRSGDERAFGAVDYGRTFVEHYMPMVHVAFNIVREGNHVSLSQFDTVPVVWGLLADELSKGTDPFHYQYRSGFSPLIYEMLMTPCTRDVINYLRGFWNGFYKDVIEKELNAKTFVSELKDLSEKVSISYSPELSWVGELVIAVSKTLALKDLFQSNLDNTPSDERFFQREIELLNLLSVEMSVARENLYISCFGFQFGRILMWSMRYLGDDSYERFLPIPHYYQHYTPRQHELENVPGVGLLFPDPDITRFAENWRHDYQRFLKEWHDKVGLPIEQTTVVGGIPGTGKTHFGLALLLTQELLGVQERYGEIRSVKVDQTYRMKGELASLLRILRLGDSDVHGRITAVAARLIRGVLEQKLGEEIPRDSAYFQVEGWLEQPLIRRVSLNYSEDLWNFIGVAYGEEYYEEFLESIMSDGQVYIPIEIRWYVMQLLRHFPQEGDDFTKFPFGDFVYLDAPARLSEFSSRREVYFENEYTLSTMRIVGRILAESMNFPIIQVQGGFGSDRFRLSPARLVWLFERSRVLRRISSKAEIINARFSLAEMNLEVLRLISFILETLLQNISEYSLEELEGYDDFNELQNLVA